jgi:glucosamine-phosphate N-acetyltransferase
MQQDVHIRKLEKKDIRNGFLESLEHLFKVGLTPEEAERIYENIRDNPSYRFFVAELDEQVVGVATLLIEQKFILKGAKFAYLEDMAVREGYEAQGIGRKLVETVINEAKMEGCLNIRLDCSDANTAFYEKTGGFKRKSVNRMQVNLNFVSFD